MAATARSNVYDFAPPGFRRAQDIRYSGNRETMTETSEYATDTATDSQRSLVIASQKGGVGKTTAALHLAFSLAERGHNVLLTDCDPQGAIGLSLSKKVSQHAGFSNFVDQEQSLEELRIQTRIPNFHLLPFGTVSAVETERFNSMLASGEHHGRLLYEAAQLGHDLVVMDTPSGFGGITLGALRASTHVLSPIQAEPIALRSVTQLLELVQGLRQQGYTIDLVGFLLVMLQLRQPESYNVAQEVWERFPDALLFDANVPRDPVFLEAAAAGVPVGLLRRPPPAVSHVFDLVAAELEGRLGLVEERESHGPQPLVD
jgi:chromosome partitioning protein